MLAVGRTKTLQKLSPPEASAVLSDDRTKRSWSYSGGVSVRLLYSSLRRRSNVRWRNTRPAAHRQSMGEWVVSLVDPPRQALLW